MLIFFFKTDSKKGHGLQRVIFGIYFMLLSLLPITEILNADKIEKATAYITGYRQWENDRKMQVYKKYLTFYDRNQTFHRVSIDQELYYSPMLDIGKKYTIFYISGKYSNIDTQHKSLVNYEPFYQLIIYNAISLILLVTGIYSIRKHKDDHVLWEFHPFNLRRGTHNSK